jgi:hypothetical protein
MRGSPQRLFSLMFMWFMVAAVATCVIPPEAIRRAVSSYWLHQHGLHRNYVRP